MTSQSDKGSKDVYEVARFVGIPGDAMTRFLGAMEAVGYTFARPSIDDVNELRAIYQGGKLIPVVEAARKTIRENRHLCEATLLDLFNAVQELDAAMDVSAQGRKP